MIEDNIEDGFWVFVSHSTKDFEQVRLVRNALEDSGFRPILFYLKCLEDDSEVVDLVKREIDARNRFILCDSPNAQASKYVQSEVKYIQSKKRMYEVVDLTKIFANKPNVEKDVLNLIKPFKRRTTVFLSYCRHDQSFAMQLKNQLNLAGFNVYNTDFHNSKVINSCMGMDVIKREIIETLDNGYVVGLIGEKSSNFSMEELKFAYKMGAGRVLPVVLSRHNIENFSDDLNMVQYLNLSEIASSSDKVRAIVEELLSMDLRNQSI